MTRPQDLYADEVNRIIRNAWANPEQFNAANPDAPIDPTQPMPLFVADQGIFVNGVKTDDPYPDIPENYTVPPPIVPIVQPTLRLFAKPQPQPQPQPQPYSGPLELDGTPVKINPDSTWPVGYRREKDTWSIVQQAFWFTLALSACAGSLASPA